MLVNFGALTAFVLLNVAVIWWFIVKQKSRRWFVHLVPPVLAPLEDRGWGAHRTLRSSAEEYLAARR